MIRKCAHCQVEFDLTDKPKGWMANHSRWCNDNPKRTEYVKKNNGSQLRNNEEKRIAGIIAAHANGKYDGVAQKIANIRQQNGTANHSEETKLLLKEKALKSDHRRLVKSTRKYTQKDGTVVLLDSSWEEKLAKRLDELNISWVRPEPMKWVDNMGNKRNYFPDFYLPDFDLYLDPKNPMAMIQQKEKVDWLKANIKNLKFLLNEKEIETFSP